MNDQTEAEDRQRKRAIERLFENAGHGCREEDIAAAYDAGRARQEVVAFLNDIAAVCQKHNMGLSHEDAHGCFEIVSADKFDLEWLMAAYDRRTAS